MRRIEFPRTRKLRVKRLLESLVTADYAAIQRELLSSLGATEHDAGTPPDAPTAESASFYREGLFAGLPTIGSIPDGIYDLKAAATFFPGINRFDKNAAAAFVASLTAMGHRGRDFFSRQARSPRPR